MTVRKHSSHRSKPGAAGRSPDISTRSRQSPVEPKRAKALGHRIDRVRVEPASTAIRPKPKDAIQRVLFTAQQPTRNVTPSIDIQETVNGNIGRLEIYDKTVGQGGNFGTLSGFLRYSINHGELTLMHIETHPPRFGLGALLLYMLALAAQRENASKILIGTAAHTAIEAYVRFGATASDPLGTAVLAQQYKQQYERRDGFQALNGKLRAVVVNAANQRLEKERYFNPTMSQQEANTLKDEYFVEAMERVGNQTQEARNQGNLRALSVLGLEFDTSVLKNRSGNAAGNRWRLTNLSSSIRENHF